MSTPFSFLVHFRNRLQADFSCLHPALGKLPEGLYRSIVHTLPLPSVEWGKVQSDGAPIGEIRIVPTTPEMMLHSAPEKSAERITRAIQTARDQGFNLVGLGALTAPVMQGGLALRRRMDVGITNGNAFTAAIMHDTTRNCLAARAGTQREIRRMAVVGASGSVGSCLSRLIARDGDVENLLLVARNSQKLERFAREIRGGATQVTTSTNLSDLQDMDMVVVLTSSKDALIGPEHLAPHAVVLDGTQPRNTSADLTTVRPDVVVVDGGIVSISGLKLQGGGFGLARDQYFACFSECVLLSLSGHQGHFSLGRPTVDQVDHLRHIASTLADRGFVPAPFQSFGNPLEAGRLGQFDATCPPNALGLDLAA